MILLYLYIQLTYKKAKVGHSAATGKALHIVDNKIFLNISVVDKTGGFNTNFSELFNNFDKDRIWAISDWQPHTSES